MVFAQGLVLTPIVIKVAGAETFGAYVLLISYMGIMFGISSMGVGVSAKRWLPSTEGAAERAARFYPQFWFQMLSVLFLATLSALAYAALATSTKWQFAGFSAWMIPMYLLAYTLYSQGTDYFRYTHRMGIFNISTVAQPYLFVFLAVGIYWATDILNIGSLLVSLIIACASVGGLMFVGVHREIGLPWCLPDRPGIGKEIKLGFPLVLAYLVDVILSGGDRYIIAAVLSVRDVGAYVPAYALGSLAMVLPKVFGVVLPPLISQRIDAGDDEGARNLSEGAARVFLLISVPYALGAMILGKDVLSLYANQEVAQVAWPVIPIVAVASIFYGLILLKANILFVRMKTGVLMQVNVMSAILNTGLNVILLQLFRDVVMAAVATLASYAFTYFLVARKLRDDRADFSPNLSSFSSLLLPSTGMLACLVALEMTTPAGFPATLLKVLAGLASFLALILVDRKTRTKIASVMKSMGLIKCG